MTPSHLLNNPPQSIQQKIKSKLVKSSGNIYFISRKILKINKRQKACVEFQAEKFYRSFPILLK